VIDCEGLYDEFLKHSYGGKITRLKLVEENLWKKIFELNEGSIESDLIIIESHSFS
jgi:hypothetical protein